MRFLLILLALFSFTAFAGRYELHVNQKYPAQSLMIDTQTGKIWKQACYSKIGANGSCEVEAWSPQVVSGVTLSEAEIWKAAQEADKK